MQVEVYVMVAWLGFAAGAGAVQATARADGSEMPPSLDFLEFLGGLVEVGDELLGPEDIEDMALPVEGDSDRADGEAEAPADTRGPRGEERR